MNWPPILPRGFPLTVTNRGYMKRINGKPKWICGKRPPEEALAIYHRKAAALTSGQQPVREPERISGVVTMHYILGRWLVDRRRDAEQGRLKPETWMQYKLSGKRIGADFARRAIEHLRSCAAHAIDSRWVRDVHLGRRVAAGLVVRDRATMKWKLYTADQVKQIIAGVDAKLATCDGRGRPSWQQVKAMIFLALNGGYGAKELSELPRDVVDLAGAKIDYRRGKTGKPHIVPLWPETVDALREVMLQRTGDDLVFRTREGNPWCRVEPVMEGGKLKKISGADHANERFSELTKGIGLKIKGQGFYKLKHLFATTADKHGDRNAVSILMGHGLPGSRGHYIDVGEVRLREVVEKVRHELLLPQSSKGSSDIIAS